MPSARQHLSFAFLIIAMAVSASGQTSSVIPGEPPNQFQVPQPPAMPSDVPAVPAASEVAPSIQPLLDFKDSDVKFDLRNMMDILRDRRHEGWVLAAYPDPKTRRPLIGAGFSLDLPSREHRQRDPLNPHPFLEPSSGDLWRAAGLDPGRLQNILELFRNRFPARTVRRHRTRIGALAPQITDREATLLLRISVVQAIYNAKAYSRNFDQLAASQQMALSQLVYQMGVNLDEFSDFLRLINTDSSNNDFSAAPPSLNSNGEVSGYWKAVQQSLIQSQWARLYRTRAVAVIAMLDPQYPDDPVAAEQRVGATLRPAVVHRRGGRSTASYQIATNSRSRGRKFHRTAPHAKIKRRA